jgi:hypothetical protein
MCPKFIVKNAALNYLLGFKLEMDGYINVYHIIYIYDTQTIINPSEREGK